MVDISWCLPLRFNRDYPSFPVIMDGEDAMSQLINPEYEKRRNIQTSNTSNLGYAHTDVLKSTNLRNIRRNRNVSLTHSKQEFEPDRMNAKIWIKDYEQAPSGDCAARGINRQVIPLNIEIGRNCYSIVTTQTLLDNCLMIDTSSKFPTIGLLRFSNQGNENCDFSTASRYIESSISVKIPTDSSSEDHHKQNNVKKVRTILKDKFSLGCARSEITGTSKEFPSSNTEESELNIGIARQRSVTDDELEEKDSSFTKMARQFTKYAQNAQKMLLKCDSENTTTVGTRRYACILSTLISNPGMSDFVQSSSEDDTPAFFYPSSFCVGGQTCPVRQKVLNTKSKFKHHNKQHSGERPFICNICQQIFAQNSNLKSCMLVHTAVKPQK